MGCSPWVRYPSAGPEISNRIYHSPFPEAGGRAVLSQVAHASLFRVWGEWHWVSSCKPATGRAPRWWRDVASLFPGDVCVVSAALMFHLISFRDRAHLSPQPAALGCRTNSLHFWPLWVEPVLTERLLGAGWVAFVPPSSYWEVEGIPASFPLEPKPPYLFKCIPGNEHAQRTDKSLSSDREEMIVALHL